MIPRFFIDRPIFANVIAIVTILVGVVALFKLPVERYPMITPPTVTVSTFYPGADARTVANTVAAPIEQQVNGVENMMYMSSTCSADGGYSLTVTFEIGTNLDQAQVLVQNRIAVAEPQLPEEVRRQGVTVRKQSTSIVLAISLTSKNGTYDGLFLANYATLRLRDDMGRVPGVGDVVVRGVGAYSMRVWLNPERLQARGLSTNDVVAALRRQNVQVAAGQIGQSPVGPGQQFQYTVTTMGRLSEPEQFEGIILKSSEGRVTYLRDVAKVELGAETYDSFSSRTGLESANLLIYQLPIANALEVAKNVRAAIEQLSVSFPPGMEYSIPFDTTKFVDQAITEVYWTLLEAGGLVLIVIMVFLQSWRALLVPATTVPVTIIGAFAFMPLLGFSVNLLTLFGLVLAIGIVVDDAIVIVENAMHHVERGLPPREATIKAMDEVTGPVIAITLVLMAVFLPTAFLGGITGQLYRQFALTIATTAFISAINALTLKPAQCATWLKPPTGRKNFLVRGFNYVYGLVESGYTQSVRLLIWAWWLVLGIFVAVVVGTFLWYQSLPTGFLPEEDQGYVIVSIQLPDAASLDRTKQVIAKVNDTLKGIEGIENWFVLGGFSLLEGTSTPNSATCFIAWTDWGARRSPELAQAALVAKVQAAVSEIQEAFFLVLVPPAIQGLDVAGGFKMQVEDREGAGLGELQRHVQEILEEARTRPEISPRIASTFRAGVPQIYLNIDRVKAEKMGVLVDEIFQTLQATLGSVYVNDFNRYDRTYQVRVQADQAFRREPKHIARLEVRNRRGEMVPLGTLLAVENRTGPSSVLRYNLYQAASINGAAATGVSSGEALRIMEDIAHDKLPSTMNYEWTGIAFQEKRITGEAIFVFGFAVLMVYLVLAAQYESWLLPLAVILVVPLGLLGVVAAVYFREMSNNIYTQIGVVLIIALASKNAILIVEFARELRLQGRPLRQAAIDAARLRFRPIIMTSFAFILGVMPLVFARGAGAASRQALGTAVFGGMLTSTILAVFFVPVFFVVIQWISEHLPGRKAPPPDPAKAPAT